MFWNGLTEGGLDLSRELRATHLSAANGPSSAALSRALEAKAANWEPHPPRPCRQPQHHVGDGVQSSDSASHRPAPPFSRTHTAPGCLSIRLSSLCQCLTHPTRCQFSPISLVDTSAFTRAHTTPASPSRAREHPSRAAETCAQLDEPFKMATSPPGPTTRTRR